MYNNCLSHTEIIDPEAERLFNTPVEAKYAKVIGSTAAIIFLGVELGCILFLDSSNCANLCGSCRKRDKNRKKKQKKCYTKPKEQAASGLNRTKPAVDRKLHLGPSNEKLNSAMTVQEYGIDGVKEVRLSHGNSCKRSREKDLKFLSNLPDRDGKLGLHHPSGYYSNNPSPKHESILENVTSNKSVKSNKKLEKIVENFDDHSITSPKGQKTYLIANQKQENLFADGENSGSVRNRNPLIIPKPSQKLSKRSKKNSKKNSLNNTQLPKSPSISTKVNTKYKNDQNQRVISGKEQHRGLNTNGKYMHSGSDKMNPESDKVHSGSDKVHSGSDKLNSGSDKMNPGSDKMNSVLSEDYKPALKRSKINDRSSDTQGLLYSHSDNQKGTKSNSSNNKTPWGDSSTIYDMFSCAKALKNKGKKPPQLIFNSSKSDGTKLVNEENWYGEKQDKIRMHEAPSPELFNSISWDDDDDDSILSSQNESQTTSCTNISVDLPNNPMWTTFHD